MRELPGRDILECDPVTFMAKLFDNLLPGMEYFTPNYSLLVGRILFYGVMYTVIALLFGLILFEDRDLA